MASNQRFAEDFYNGITYLGVLISVLVFIAEVFLFILDFLSHGSNPYLGLVTYFLLPCILFFGLFLIPLGVVWKRSRVRRGLPPFELNRLRVDLAIPTHRNALLVFIIGTSLLALMSLVGSYHAYHVTESVTFCGTACHTPMHPEFTAYQHSPHKKIECVECHVGSGAGPFIQAKMAGLSQLFHYVMGSYDRPIKTPVKNLRPARDACLHCHSHERAFAAKHVMRTYYLADQDNKEWRIQLLLNLGSNDPRHLGVHQHMNVARDIYYAAEDERRQKITWVKSVGHDGTEKIYVTKSSKFAETPPPPELIRKMDCIDCHNRPTHKYFTPDELVNDAIAQGKLTAEMPQVKAQGVSVLGADYESTEAAMAGIDKSIRDYYSQDHAEYAARNQKTIDSAVTELRRMYSSNMFPAMKARWDAYPDNNNHMISDGCFRCHDGKHRTKEGEKIVRDCKSCHIIIGQGPPDDFKTSLEGLEFEHPDGEEDWKTELCHECHTGAGT